jgi:hypothetical protein
MAVHTPWPSVVSAPATVVYAITWLFSVACAAQTYCESGFVAVSPNPPVAPELGAGVGVAVGAAVGVACGVAAGTGVEEAVVLEVGAGVDDPHPISAMPAMTDRRSVRIPDEDSRREPSGLGCGSID